MTLDLAGVRNPEASPVGLFGPESVSWRVNREALVLAGGSCALLMQLAHPAVAAGVAEHSDFRARPWDRLRRTLNASYAVIFGSTARAEQALHRIDAIHGSVRGTVPETGERYDARDPSLLLWVHATLVDTALRVYDRFVQPLAAVDAETYHREARVVAVGLGVPEELIPATLAQLRGEMERLIGSGEVHVTPTARALAPAILHPNRLPARAWEAAHLISLSVLHPEIRRGYGIGWSDARERGVERLASATRHLLPLVPAPLRFVPAARAAERRLGRGVRTSAGSPAG
jgi:uncharacterized protein (DUF2236 family)